MKLCMPVIISTIFFSLIASHFDVQGQDQQDKAFQAGNIPKEIKNAEPERINYQSIINDEVQRIERQLNDLDKRITNQINSLGESKNLINVLIATQFAIIVGFLTLAGWIELKAKKTLKVLGRSVEDAKKNINNHLESELNSFQNQLEKISDTILKAKGAQDLLLSGKVLYWTGKYEKALEPLNEAISIDSDDLEAIKFRGLCERRLGLDNLTQSIIDLEKVTYSDLFKNDPELHLELAQAALTNSEYDKAIRHANLADLNGHRSKEEIKIIIADSLQGLKKYDEAGEIYDSIVEDNPRSTPAVLKKGATLSFQKRFDDLIDLYSSAIDNRGDICKYHIYLGAAYAERDNPGDWDLALKAFDDAASISETDWDLWYFKGRAFLNAWLRLDTEDRQESDFINNAIDCFSTGEKLAKTTSAPRFINQMSRVHLLTGRIDDAIIEARRSVKANPNFIQNHLTLCTALLAGKKWPEVTEAIEQGMCCALNNPGKIWCLYFKILNKLLQRYEINSIEDLLKDLVDLLEESPYFDTKYWDWDTTHNIVEDEIERLDENTKVLITDLNELLDSPSNYSSFKARWVEQ